MSQEQLKPSQQEVELDTDGVEAKEVSYEVKEPEKKLTLPNDEVIPEGTAVNEHKDDKIEVVEAKEEPKEDKPEEGKVYALTGGPGARCIANGYSWKDSVVEDDK